MLKRKPKLQMVSPKRGKMPSDAEWMRGDAALEEPKKTAEEKDDKKSYNCAKGEHEVEVDTASGLRVCVRCRAVVIPKPEGSAA
jgi:hypothetical protein